MNSVITFGAVTLSQLEKDINNWVKAKGIKIISVSISFTSADEMHEYVALIAYED
ncbi:TPA: hypothetical protein JIS15_04120 [Acinetobacter baumannii]|uniref:hypothetical protein n=1 Tax=Acinetobacter calcoaceticus/baumannii complex TaxID=909768 RepID=UPI00148D56D9|nr:hypothetical protein [Acinetobacter pittii]HAV4558744.1 hypothetical protein [Acinetobacter baumannii]